MKPLMLMLLLSTSFQSVGFHTLNDVIAYAQTLDEHAQPDANSLPQPSFTEVNKKQSVQSLKKYGLRFLEAVGLKKKPLWSSRDLLDSLDQVTEHLKKEPIAYPYAFMITAELHDRFYIVGDLEGAFHSLVRYLTYLYEHKIITKDLIFQKPFYYLIFNGNAIGSSPYNSETLTLILTLILKNRANVFYLAGKNETGNYWTNQNLSSELSLKAPEVSYFSLSSFFKKLPTALYLKELDGNFIQISWYKTTYSLLSHEKECAQKRLCKIKIDEKVSPPSFVPISARIVGIDRSISYQETQGLELAPSEKGQTSWSVFSSPTFLHRKLYHFHYDAFAELIPSQKADEWKITLIKKEAATKEPFSTVTFLLTTGKTVNETAEAQVKPPLLFGCTLDLSKTSASLGKRLREGIELRIRKENLSGGIKGHPLKVVFLDDSYTPRLAKQNVQTFLSTYKTSLIFCPLGTPTTEAYLPLVQEGKVTLLFPCTGAPIFRKESLTHIVNLRTSYAREAEALVTYAVKTLQGRKFALFYQDDAYGQGPLHAAQATLKSLGIKDWLETSYLRNNPNIEGPAKKIIDFNPDVILFFSTPGPSASLIHKLGINKVANTILMGISFLTDVFRNFLLKKGLTLIMSQVMPNYKTSLAPLVVDYRKDMEQLNPDGRLSSDSLEGYANASVLIEALKKVSIPFTPEELLRTLEGFKNYEYKGFLLNFNPSTRELLKEVWIDPGGDAEWILSHS